MFKDNWTEQFLFIQVGGKPMCLICSDYISVNKECNLKRHYQTKHVAKYEAYTGQLRKDKIATLRSAMAKQQDVFTKRNAESASNVEASFAVSP